MSKALTDEQTERLATRLRQLRTTLSDDLQALEDEALGSAEAPLESQADAGVIGDAQDQDLALLGSGREVLRDVERALERLRDGSYGLCTDCGQWIPYKRLASLPTARLCKACELRAEREEART